MLGWWRSVCEVERLVCCAADQGRRIGKTVYVHNGTTWTLDSERCYVWDGWLLLLETDGSDQVLRRAA